MRVTAGVVTTGAAARQAAEANAAVAQRIIAALQSARRLAIAAATEEAEEYADALGMRIARVLRVSERSARSGSDGYITVTGNRSSGTPIEPGDLETQVQVWVDYALAPR